MLILYLLYSSYSKANQGKRVFREDLVQKVRLGNLDLEENLVTLGNQDNLVDQDQREIREDQEAMANQDVMEKMVNQEDLEKTETLERTVLRVVLAGMAHQVSQG